MERDAMIAKRYPKEVVLTDGREVTLRPIEETDREAVLAFYDRMPPDETWFYKDVPSDPEVVRRWVASLRSGEAVSILALDGERVAAHAALLARRHGGRRHIGRLRLRIDPGYRGKRLGNWMLFDMIRRAMELGLEILRAEFVVGVEDEAAEALRAWDFGQETILEGYLKDRAGNPCDYRIMLKRLHKEWSDF